MKWNRSLALALCSIAVAVTGANAQQDITWNRQAHGQKFLLPGGDPNNPNAYYTWPDDNLWSQIRHDSCANGSNPCNAPYESQPSNWSTDYQYPDNGNNAILGSQGGGGTQLDVNVTLNKLTIQPGGALGMNFGTTLNASAVDFQTGGTIVSGGGGGHQPTIQISDGGTLVKSAGSDGMTLDANVALNVANATIACQAGSLTLGGANNSYTGTVKINPSAGTTVYLLIGGDIYGGGGGMVVQGTVTSESNGGHVVLSTNNIHSGAAGGTTATLAFPGDIFHWTGGAISSYNAAAIYNTGTITADGPNREILAGAGFHNKGTFITSAGATLDISGVTNDAGGVWDLHGDDNHIGSQQGGSPFFENAGTLKKSTSAGGTSYIDQSIHIINDANATIESDAGTLQLGAQSDYTGAVNFNVASGARVLLNSFGDIYGGGAATTLNGATIGSGNNTGSVVLSNGVLQSGFGHGPSMLNFPGNVFQWTGGAITAGANDPLVNAGTINAVGPNAVITSSVGVSNAGTFNLAANVTHDVNGTFTNAAGGTYVLNGDGNHASPFGGGSPRLANIGTLVKNASSGGTSYIDQNLSLDNSGTLSVTAGTLEIDTPPVQAQEQSDSALNTYGNLVLHLTGGTWSIGANSTLTIYKVDGNGNHAEPITLNQGDIRLTGAKAVFTNLFSGNALALKDNEGSLSLSDAGNMGTLTDLINNGALNLAGATTVTVNGNYTQGTNGTLNFTIPSGSASKAMRVAETTGSADASSGPQLLVTGTANVGGTLNISAAAGSQPAPGTVYSVFSAGAINGQFANVNITGFTGRVSYSSKGISVTVTNTTPARLLNISTRMEVLTGDNVLIGGFIVTGSDAKKVLIRAIGPSLPVGGALADPVLELHDGSGNVIASNDNWKVNDATGQSQQSDIEATGVPPTSDLEAALLATLPANNAAYTAVVRGKSGGSGIGLVEVYDLGAAANSQLANISTRGFVDTNDNVMIGGFIAGPNANANTHVLVRAIGPSLPVGNALTDPLLELHDLNGAIVASNDNWKVNDATGQSQEADIRATGVPPTKDAESALLYTAVPGNYTAVVRGKNSGTGVALVEIFNLQ